MTDAQPAATSKPLERWITAGWAVALSLTGLWIATHGGQLPDLSSYTADQINALGALPTIRFMGVLYQVCVAAPLLIAFWIAAMGYGRIWRRSLPATCTNALLIQTGLGLGSFMWILWLISWAGLLGTLVAWLCLLGGMALSLHQFFRHQANSPPQPQAEVPTTSTKTTETSLLPSSWRWRIWLSVLPVVGLYVVAGCMPPGTLWKVEAFGYDVTSYHLQLPKEWLALGQMRGLNHNVYSFFPGLMEVGYLYLSTLLGSTYQAIYLCQMLHLTMALFTAICIARGVARHVSSIWGQWAACAFLVVPWTMIVSTLAYNEMTAMALGATALLLVFDPAISSRAAAIGAGALTGGATLAKLTAGPMLGLPVLLAWVFRLNHQTDSRRWHIAWIILAGTVTLSPWLARNALQTGNPVFPFAAQIMGRGHWSTQDVKRWNQAHANHDPWDKRVAALGWQWLGNEGFGSLGGQRRIHQSGTIESRNIARFDHEWGIPTFWMLAIAGGIISLWHTRLRRPATLLWIMLLCQLGFWLIDTHLQSRFLIWTLLPGSLMIGLGSGALTLKLKKPLAWLMGLLIGGWILAGTFLCFNLFFSQTPAHYPPWYFIDSMPKLRELDQMQAGQAIAGDNLLNHLPSGSKVYLVADSSRLLYIRHPMIYHSAFDPSPLGQWIRQAQGDPQAVTRQMIQQGITHVWVHYSELARLHATYGYDSAVTPDTLQRLIQTGWTIQWHDPHNIAVLYAIAPAKPLQ